MTTLLTSLPGDIPGLLRRCSPVVRLDIQRPGVVESIGQGWAAVAHDVNNGSLLPIADFALDLTDPTGRAHAAWWVRTQIRWPADDDEAEMLDRARYADDMTPEQVDTLARLVLRLAGRAA